MFKENEGLPVTIESLKKEFTDLGDGKDQSKACPGKESFYKIPSGNIIFHYNPSPLLILAAAFIAFLIL